MSPGLTEANVKIHEVKKSRKDRICNKCGEPIKAGSPYRWWKHMRAPQTSWHWHHGGPKPSDLTTSDKLARVLEAREAIEEAFENLEAIDKWLPSVDDEGYLMLLGELIAEIEDALIDVQDAINDNIDELRNVAYEYEESADNVEEYFGPTDNTEEWRERAYSIESYADQIEGIDIETLLEALADEDNPILGEYLVKDVEDILSEYDGAYLDI
jgi:hypothetical protein